VSHKRERTGKTSIVSVPPFCLCSFGIVEVNDVDQ